MSELREVVGGYKVSEDGKVFNSSGRELKSHLNKHTGYYTIVLSIDKVRKTKGVHQLVYEGFSGKEAPKKGSGYCIDHIDNDKTNNHFSNLQVITERHNATKDKWRYNRHSEFIGVTRHGNNSWAAEINIDGKLVRLGSYKNEFEASDAYQKRLKEEMRKVCMLDKVTREVLAVFDTITKASKETGCNPSSIVRCCKRNGKSTGGFGWKYKEPR